MVVSTGSLQTRSQRLFGSVHVLEGGYGMTEIWPFGGRPCVAGHLHFEPSQGLLEVYNVETAAPVLAGETGTIVASPFLSYRETTLVLRYDTGDVVRMLPEPLTCSLRHQPATSPLLGKLSLSVRHEQGWTYPRQLSEALEALEEVPLPARYGCWAVSGGVAVEVVVRDDSLDARRKIETSLEEQGVPVRELHLLGDRRQLRHPMPLRGDLREQAFSLPVLDRTATNKASVLQWQAEETRMGGQ